MTARLGTYERLAPRHGDVARVVNDVRDGKIDCTGSLVMAAGTTSTEVRDLRLTEQSVMTLVPTSEGAAAVAWWRSARTRGSQTIGHDSVAGDTAFDWLALG